MAMSALPRRLLLALLAAGIALAGALAADCSSRQAARPERATSAAQPERTDAAARRSVGFRSRERLLEHWRKHGREFGAASPEAYLELAQALRDAAVGGAVLEHVRGDGVVVRFDRRTGSFIAFEPGGVIRTFFKPGDGERYFARQALRGRRGP